MPRSSASPAGTPPDLLALARQAMLDADFAPDMPHEVATEVDRLRTLTPLVVPRGAIRDLRALPWSSIDNTDTRDLDQIEVAEQRDGGDTRLLIGLADVDWLAPLGSAIDRQAARNTTSVYTGAVTFPMLPEALSTDLTSLREGTDRFVIVVELRVGTTGDVREHDIYRAVARNHAQLDYASVGAWLEGAAPPPPRVSRDAVLADQLRVQDAAARAMRAVRARRGALEIETIEARAVVTGGTVVGVEVTRKNRARELIEDLMIATNVAMAEFLVARGSPWIRRVVRTPKRWLRIVALAEQAGDTLPAAPDPLALAEFLARRKVADPAHFPDISLSVVKLLGSGEYMLGSPTAEREPHFGLAVQDYSHSTAPNRRYADLVTQRLLKACLARAASPYSESALTGIAARCTRKEDDANKVERTMRKVAAAALLAGREGEAFDAIVTGAKPDATYVRLLAPPVEGRVVRGEAGLDVGDPVRVTLVRTDAAKGFIDFARVD
ncbi:MAG: RNB domain-containing ribonuclease [Gemmatimonadaceae bacterium]